MWLRLSCPGRPAVRKSCSRESMQALRRAARAKEARAQCCRHAPTPRQQQGRTAARAHRKPTACTLCCALPRSRARARADARRRPGFFRQARRRRQSNMKFGASALLVSLAGFLFSFARPRRAPRRASAAHARAAAELWALSSRCRQAVHRGHRADAAGVQRQGDALGRSCAHVRLRRPHAAAPRRVARPFAARPCPSAVSAAAVACAACWWRRLFRRLFVPASRVFAARRAPTQFLCYKQLKKFLKQLPDTSAGAALRRAAGLRRVSCAHLSPFG